MLDIFKFHNPGGETLMAQGEIINNIKSKLWIERFTQPGEFKLVADVSSGLREKLPLGTFISHTWTNEIHMVENHEITHERGKNPEIVVSGRSFDAFLDYRVVGIDRDFPSNTMNLYDNVGGDLVSTVDMFLKRAINTAQTNDDDNALLNVTNLFDGDIVETLATRRLDRGSVHKELMTILETYNLGFKPLRPDAPAVTTSVRYFVYNGEDQIDTVSFSYEADQLERAEYLWSNKLKRNSVLVAGKYVGVHVHSADTGYERRQMYIDASYLDNELTAQPTGTQYTDLQAEMTEIGNMALAINNKEVIITKVEIAKDVNLPKFRSDYWLGDLVTVYGDYNSVQTMRAIEHVEIEDETGYSAYPTLVPV